ncbi:MAG: hypothetical protein AABZ60_13205 [Planctomycetota bacterium]
MPGRDLTPSEKIDQEYERMIQMGAALIVISVLLVAAYLGLTNQEDSDDAVVFFFDQKAHSDPNYSSKGKEFKSENVESHIVDPKFFKQRQQTFQIEDDENLPKTEKHKVAEDE